MKPISTFATKIVILVLLVVGTAASVGWYVFDANKGIAISFSDLEKTIQAENGQQVSLKEKSDGTVYLQTKDALYVTQVRPQSQLVEQLVEKYNITYKYSDQSEIDGLVIGGLSLRHLLHCSCSIKKGRLASVPLP